MITGIGQGYIEATPLQLCIMTAQLANGGFKIKPRIIYENLTTYDSIKFQIEQKLSEIKLNSEIKNNTLIDTVEENDFLKPLFRNQENIKFVLEAMFGSTNEPGGTSYSSRHSKKKYQYAGKTGTAQVKRITEAEREADLRLEQIPYKNRDHAIFVAFAPYKDPRYAISVFIEHGGSGSKTAAPIAKKLLKEVIDRHSDREKYKQNELTKT